MERPRLAELILVLSIPAGLLAQDGSAPGGVEWGAVAIHPEASILGAHDNRVQFDRTSGKATSDFYSEVAGGLSIENLSARYSLSANGSYGYRFYTGNPDLNDDFYGIGGAVASGENPLKWGLSADIAKMLNYDTGYNPSTGDGPGSILVDGPNRSLTIQGNIGYEKQLTEKSSIVPGYNLQHHYQELPDSGTAEWQIHDLNIELQKKHSAKTQLTARGDYSLQVNNDENGSIGTIEVGAGSRMSEKVSWQASLGYSVANYEISGRDQSGVVNLRIFWQATEKVSAYVFGGNDYQPGYDSGAARMVYRVGYGASWSPFLRWVLGGSVLHDYQDSVGGGSASPGAGEVRNFLDAHCTYRIARRLLLSFSGRYVDDDLEASQTVFSLGLDYKY